MAHLEGPMCILCDWANAKSNLARQVQRIGQEIDKQCEKAYHICGQNPNKWIVENELKKIRCEIRLRWDEEEEKYVLFYSDFRGWSNPKEHISLSLNQVREMVSNFDTITNTDIRDAVYAALAI